MDSSLMKRRSLFPSPVNLDWASDLVSPRGYNGSDVLVLKRSGSFVSSLSVTSYQKSPATLTPLGCEKAPVPTWENCEAHGSETFLDPAAQPFLTITECS